MAAGSMSVEKTQKKSSSAPGTPPVVQQKATIRVIARLPGERGSRCRVVVSIGTAEEQDVTGALTASLAHALWQLRGGVDIGNWVDGETLLDHLLSETPAPATVEAQPQVVVPAKRTVTRR